MPKLIPSFLALAAAAAACAAIVPKSPAGGEEIKLVADAQKKVMNLPTYAERLDLLKADRARGKELRHDKHWRKALPVVLTWEATAGEKGPWKIEVAKKPDFSDARTWYVAAKKTDKASGRATGAATGGATVRYGLPYANLEINATYYWRVSARGRCNEWNCGPKCKCAESKTVVTSGTAAFRTEDFAPRWMAIEGSVGNMRDLGGRKTTDGRRVRQGMIYRGQGLNHNSVNGERPGRNRLTVADVEYMTGELGIKTDLDLRSVGETAGMAVSPLGRDVKFIHHPSACYAGIFTKGGMETMAKNVRVFCDPANYPIYFHCIGGADRAGSLAYVLNGALGVARHGLETDWESTFYPTLSEMRDDYTGRTYWCGEWHFDDGFSKYGDADTPWEKRVELYLLACGLTREELEKFRAIMLVKE